MTPKLAYCIECSHKAENHKCNACGLPLCRACYRKGNGICASCQTIKLENEHDTIRLRYNKIQG